MAKASVSGDNYETAQMLARLGESVFIPVHITNNWKRFQTYDKNWGEALKLFAWGYAFEHNGAPPSYRREALRALEICENSLDTEEAPQKIWKIFQSLLGNRPVNPKSNPLNPGKTPYFDVVTFCKTVAAPDEKNPYLFSLRKIEANNLWEAHVALMRIRGVGPKIASLFLRDITLRNNMTDIGLSDRHLLQPIDVWLERTTKLLIGGDVSKNDAGRGLTSLADEAGCSAPHLNAGSWYFGSKVARTKQRLEVDLKTPQNFISAVERHHKSVQGEAAKEEAGLLGDFLREFADHTGKPSRMSRQGDAGEKPDRDRFTWHLEDVVWIKPGQTDEEAFEEAKRRRASKTKVGAPNPATAKMKNPQRESLAGYLTKLLEVGGNIEEITKKANLVAERLRLKPITVGRVRAHAKWRSRGGRYTLKSDDDGFIQMVRAA